MGDILRHIGRFVIGFAISATVSAVWLLIAWQVIVVGLVDGPGALAAVAAAGVASGVVLLIAHELGHAVAGWAVGLPPLSLTLVFVRIDWAAGRPKVRPNAQLFRPAGVASHAVNAASWRVAVMVAAGPVVSLAMAGASLATAAVVNPGPQDLPVAARSGWREVALLWPGSGTAGWLNVAGLTSLLLGALTLVPGRSAGLRTDGGQLLDLARRRWRPTGPAREHPPGVPPPRDSAR